MAKGGGGSRATSTAGSRNRERVFAGNFANNSTSPRRSQILGNLIASANARTARSEARGNR